MKMKKIFESFERFKQEMKEFPGEEIEYIRIDIAKEIDDILQRPSNDQEINNLLKTGMPGVTKRSANLLLYLYKGVDEKGNLLDNEDVKAVMDELDIRVENFLDSFETQAHFLVFLNDAPSLINEFLPLMRETSKPDSHQSKFMLKTAPGNFDAFQFAKKKPFAVFKDTTANSGMKDFMHKQTPELNNINPQHHYLFKLEYLIKIAYEVVQDSIDVFAPDKDQIDIVLKPLDMKSFVSNYIKGITLATQDHRDTLKQTPHPTISPLLAGQRHKMNRLFRYYYYGEYLRDTEEQQIKLIDDYLPQIIDIDTAQVQSGLVPSYSLLLSMVYSKFPRESQKKYELPFYKILHTAKNSKFINWNIKDIIKQPGVLDIERTENIPMLPLGGAGETEDYRKQFAEKQIDDLIIKAKNKQNIQSEWQEFQKTWIKLSKETKEFLSDKLEELKIIIKGGK